MFIMKTSILIGVFLLALALSAKGASSSGETRYSCKAFEQQETYKERTGKSGRRIRLAESITVGGKEFESSRNLDPERNGRPINPITDLISIKDLKTVLLINDSSSTLKVLQSGKKNEEFGKKGSCLRGEGFTTTFESDEPTLKAIRIAEFCEKDADSKNTYTLLEAEVIPDSTPIAFTTRTREIRGSSGTKTFKGSEWIETSPHIRPVYPEYKVVFAEADNVFTIGYRSKSTGERLVTRYGCALETL